MHPKHFRVSHHGRVRACDVKVALVELPEAAAVHLWVVPAVHFPYVVSLDVTNAVQRHVSRKWYCQVVSAPALHNCDTLGTPLP